MSASARAGHVPALLISLSAAAAVACVVALATSITLPDPDWLRLLGALALIAICTRMLRIKVRLGSNGVAVNWGDAALLLGLVLVPPAQLVLVALLANTVVFGPSKLPRRKAIFNVATNTTATALAGAAAWAIAPWPYSISSLRDIGALVAAAVVFGVSCDLATSTVIAWSQDLPVLRLVRNVLPLQLLTLIGNVAAALAVLAVVEWQQEMVFVLPLLLLALHRSYRSSLNARQEREAWQHLDAATHALAQLDEQTVVDLALAGAQEIFSADVVEIELGATSAGPERRFRRGTLGQDQPDAYGSKHDAPLEIPGAPLGRLSLLFASSVSLSERERRALSTFGAALTAALLNAQLFEQTRELADRKAFEAAHDPLTGLANRTLLVEQGTARLEAAVEGDVVALLLLDLDGFKDINDTLGHDAGDQLLQLVAERLTYAVRRGDLVARLGGDEFALLLTDLRDPSSAVATASSVLVALKEPFDLDRLALSVEGSIGVACAPTDATTFPELLRRADVAMYQAKSSGSAVRRYSAARDGGSVDRLALANELRRALGDGQLQLHYQPQFDLCTGAALGAEALVRWHHPRRKLLLPADFVPVVEHTGLVLEFTLHVLDMALREQSTWAAEGIDVPVAVNLSARTLLHRQVAREMAALLEQHGVAPHQLIVEITETTMMRELDLVESVLDDLRALGVQISVDDFGTGYSSLAFLCQVPLHEVKIDQSFVAGVPERAGHAAIVRATIEMAHSMGLRVIAEGIETAQQLEALQALGCDGGQGFYLGHPVAADQARSVLRGAPRRASVPPASGARVINLTAPRTARPSA